MKSFFCGPIILFLLVCTPIEALVPSEPEGIKLSDWMPTSGQSYYLLHKNIHRIALAQNPRFCLNIIPKSKNLAEELPYVDYSSEHCYKYEVKKNGWYDLTTLLLPLSSQSIEDVNLACQFVFGKKAKALYYRNKIIPKPVSNVYSLKKENIANLYFSKENNTETLINNLHINQSKQIHSIICSHYDHTLIPHYLGKSPERKFAWAPIKKSDQLKLIVAQETAKLKKQFKLISHSSFLPSSFELDDLKQLKNVLIYLDGSSTLQRIKYKGEKGLDLALKSLKAFLQMLPTETKVTIIITPVIWDQKSKNGYTYIKRMENVSLEDAIKLTDIKNWVPMKTTTKRLTPYSKLPYLTVDSKPVYSNKMVGSFKPSNQYDFGIFIGDGEFWSRGAPGKPETNNLNDEINFVRKTKFPFTFVRIGNNKKYHSYFSKVPRQSDKIMNGEVSLNPDLYHDLKRMKELLDLTSF